eukprot:7507980-Ditylum_brightwellii.AAC.1
MHAVAEAERTAIALVKEKSLENQDDNYDSSSSSCFDTYTASSYGGQFSVPYLAALYPSPTFVEKFFDAFKYCHASTL